MDIECLIQKLKHILTIKNQWQIPRKILCFPELMKAQEFSKCFHTLTPPDNVIHFNPCCSCTFHAGIPISDGKKN